MSVRMMMQGRKPAGVLVFDSFNRADSTTSLGTADTGEIWTAHAGTWGIISNKAYKVTSSATDAWATVDAGASDIAVSCDITTSSDAIAQDHGLILRCNGSTTYLLATLDVNDDFVRLYKRVSGSYTLLASGAKTMATSTVYAVTFTISGSSVTIDVDSVNEVSHTLSGADATTFSGLTRAGLRMNGAGNYGQRWDNFEVVAA